MRAHPASAQGHGRFWVGLLPWAWMLFFFVLPFALIVNVSLSTPDLAVPPYVSPFAGTTADGAPAFLLSVHSGVTLAPLHAGRMVEDILSGTLDPARYSAFSPERFDVQAA